MAENSDEIQDSSVGFTGSWHHGEVVNSIVIDYLHKGDTRMSEKPTSQFHGDLEGYLAFTESQYSEFNPCFCAKHWAPCPVEGRNGLLATTIMMQKMIDEMPDEVARRGADAMNLWMLNQTEPLCCKLGDEKMREIWEQC